MCIYNFPVSIPLNCFCFLFREQHTIVAEHIAGDGARSPLQICGWARLPPKIYFFEMYLCFFHSKSIVVRRLSQNSVAFCDTSSQHHPSDLSSTQLCNVVYSASNEPEHITCTLIYHQESCSLKSNYRSIPHEKKRKNMKTKPLFTDCLHRYYFAS